MATVVHKGRG